MTTFTKLESKQKSDVTGTS